MMARTMKLIFYVGIIGIVFSQQSGWAQGVPALERVISNVRKVILPVEGYRVDVIQSYFLGKADVSEEDKEDVEKDIEMGVKTAPVLQETENSPTFFAVDYDPSKGYSTSRVTQPQAQTNGILGSKASGLQAANVRVNVDLVKLMNILSSLDGVQIVFENVNGYPMYRISGQTATNNVSYLLGVDAENWYVKNALISKDGRDFYQVEMEYRQVKGQYWLLSKATIDYLGAYAKIILSFGDYEFKTK